MRIMINTVIMMTKNLIFDNAADISDNDDEE